MQIRFVRWFIEYFLVRNGILRQDVINHIIADNSIRICKLSTSDIVVSRQIAIFMSYFDIQMFSLTFELSLSSRILLT